MRPNAYFEIEFAVGEGSALAETRLWQGAEVLAFAKNNLQLNCEFLVACLGDGTDYGNLIIEIDAMGCASLRALEHSGFAVERTSKEQALQALEYWLPSQKRLPSLKWTEE